MKNGKYIDSDGTEKWYKDDVLHREEGPAVIGDNGTSLIWFQNGQMHRDNGPAMELSRELNGVTTKGQKWFLNGQEKTEQEVMTRWKAMQEKEKLDSMIANSQTIKKLKV